MSDFLCLKYSSLMASKICSYRTLVLERAHSDLTFSSLDDLFQPGKERGILEDHEMGLEDEGVLLPHLRPDVGLDPDEFALRPLDRPAEPPELVLDLAGGDDLAPRREDHPLGEGRPRPWRSPGKPRSPSAG